MTPQLAIFVDRDGVVNDLVRDETGRYESPTRPDDVRLLPGVPSALRRLGELGPVVVISNQPSAAKGRTSLSVLRLVHAAVERSLATEDVVVNDYRYCFHHPEGSDPELGRVCSCRKPEPGMILAGAAALGDIDLSRSWMVGDSDVDIEAGRRAGCRTVLVEEPLSSHRRSGRSNPDARARDLTEAAVIISRLSPLDG